MAELGRNVLSMILDWIFWNSFVFGCDVCTFWGIFSNIAWDGTEGGFVLGLFGDWSDLILGSNETLIGKLKGQFGDIFPGIINNLSQQLHSFIFPGKKCTKLWIISQKKFQLLKHQISAVWATKNTASNYASILSLSHLFKCSLTIKFH